MAKKGGQLQKSIQNMLDAASGALGSNRTLAIVFAVHIAVLLLVLFGATFFAPRPETVEPVPVAVMPPPEERPAPPAVQPAKPEPAPEKAAPKPAPAPPPPVPDEIVEKKEPEKKKIVRKKKVVPKPAPIVADTNLKERLKSSLSKVSNDTPAPAPAAAAAAPEESAVNVAGQFPYNWYLGLVQSKISANWDKPEGIMLNDGSVSCVASFRIRRDGKVTDVAVARSSGNAILDTSALEAIRACDPMPPLPERFSGPHIDIRINFNLVK